MPDDRDGEFEKARHFDADARAIEVEMRLNIVMKVAVVVGRVVFSGEDGDAVRCGR